MRRLLAGCAAVAALLLPATLPPARAQPALSRGPAVPLARDQPVFWQADTAAYDRDGGLVTLSGHVEIWQGERVMHADRITYDRATGVAAAIGNVVLMEPGGQTAFSDYAELSGGLKDGVLRGLSARLAENGKLTAAGARRTDARVNELSRAVYTTCNVCARHPERAPTWQIRARSAVQDIERKTIEYRDVVLDVLGVPVLYTPYLEHPDPSQKRASGFLIPSIGSSSRIGTFLQVPYYWVIDGQSDATLTPILASRQGPGLEVEYRRRFNDGTVNLEGSIARDRGELQGHVFTRGSFALDDQWRAGFDINRASSAQYLRDFRIADLGDRLTSSAYVEGFGRGAYVRLEGRVYQALTDRVLNARVPYVLPRFNYSYAGLPDAWGGRLGIEFGAINILRDEGTNTDRTHLGLTWTRPFAGPVGDAWTFTLHGDAAAYYARELDKAPSYGPRNADASAHALPQAALLGRWPLVRDAGDWGKQVIEPIVQLVAAPRADTGGIGRRADGTPYNLSIIPNEDSLDFDFTDANLFSLNRHPGVDRLEGGARATVALHAKWDFPGGQVLDGLVGQSFRANKDSSFPVGSGLEDRASDVVSRVSFTPTDWFDLTTRERFDKRTSKLRFADTVASAGPSWLRMSAGHLYSDTDPFFYYDEPPTGVLPRRDRQEVSLSARTSTGPWHANGFVRRDLTRGQFVAAGGGAGYEDECFAFDVSAFKRYTSFNGDRGSTTVLFQITLKTVGTFGFHAK